MVPLMMVLGWSRVSLGWCVAYGSCGLMVGMFGEGVPDTYNLSDYGLPFSNSLALACCPLEGNGIS